MDQDPTFQALENMVRSNQERIAQTEQQLQQFQALTGEIRELIAQQQGIAPEAVDEFLEKNISPQLREQAQAQLQEMQHHATASQADSGAAAAARRPAAGRRMV